MAHSRRNRKEEKKTTKKANEKNVNIKRAGFRTQNYIHSRMDEEKNSQLCGISKQTKQ